MILISHIEPLDLASKYKNISDLESDYLLKFNKYYQPKYELSVAIGKKKRGRKSIMRLVTGYLQRRRYKACR